MDPHSILDHGDSPEMQTPEQPRPAPGQQANSSVRPEELSFPGEDGGKSLAGMAQKDLIATLQLLAEQAQYITGATGAAIALRDHGEMVCLASSGSSAPEVGSQLQVNSGLSGESVRTRQTLRCDDAATDTRVNRESCEALGIASVVVMPLVQGEDVIGVFELFSNKANVFEGRDITALERMGAMVFTALEHSMAAHGVNIWGPRANGNTTFPDGEVPLMGEVPDVSSVGEMAVAAPSRLGDGVSGENFAPTRNQESRAETEGSSGPIIPDTVLGVAFHGKTPTAASSGLPPTESRAANIPWREESDDILGELAQTKESASAGEVVSETPSAPPASATGKEAGENSILEDEPISPALATGESKSAEEHVAAEESDPIRSVVANLNRCEGCGFPVSEGRRLCLDCEKKQSQSSISAMDVTGAAGHVAQSAIGSPRAVGVSEATSDDGPRFMSEEEETPWLANHKYMVVAILMAVAIILALLLAR